MKPNLPFSQSKTSIPCSSLIAMQRIFGRSKPKAPPPTLSETSDRIDLRISVLDNKIQNIDQQLLKCKEDLSKTRGPAQNRIKQRALQLLRQKRQYENQRDALYSQQMNVSNIAMVQEQIKDTKEMVLGMKAATKELKSYQKSLKIEEVEKIQDELEDLFYESQELQEVLGLCIWYLHSLLVTPGRQYGTAAEIDDSELMAEFEALGEMEDASYLDDALAVPGSKPLPAVQEPTEATTDPAQLEEQLGL